MKRPLYLLALALLPIVSVAQAAKLKIPDFSALAAKATETVNISLDGEMLKSAGGFMGGNSGNPQRDAEVADALKGVEGIYVRVFEFDQPGMYSPKDIEPILAQTKAPGWKALMQVKDGDERMEMWMHERSAGGGFLLVVPEPTDFVIVNIAGDIELQKLRALQGRMGIPGVPGLAPMPPGAAPVPPAPPATPAPGAAPARPAGSPKL